MATFMYLERLVMCQCVRQALSDCVAVKVLYLPRVTINRLSPFVRLKAGQQSSTRRLWQEEKWQGFEVQQPACQNMNMPPKA